MSVRITTLNLLEKEVANLSNEETHHCRVGKVALKPNNAQTRRVTDWEVALYFDRYSKIFPSSSDIPDPL